MRKKQSASRGGIIMGNHHIESRPPDVFACLGCGAEKKMGVGLPIFEQSFARTKAFNAAVDDFVAEHAAHKEV